MSNRGSALIWKKPNNEWMVTLPLDTFIELCSDKNKDVNLKLTEEVQNGFN